MARRRKITRKPRAILSSVDAINESVLMERIAHGMAVIVRKNKTKPYRLAQGAYPFHEILYIDSGEIGVTHERRRWMGKQGDLFLFADGQSHGQSLPEGKRAATVLVNFRGHDELVQALSPGRVTMDEAARELLAKTLAQAEPDDTGAVVLRASRLKPLFEALAARRPSGTAAAARHTVADHQQAIAAVRAHIDENIDGTLSLDVLGEVARLSKWHLSRLFHRIAGQPLKDYVTERRMVRAKELLAAGDLNVTQVAAAVGYENIHYFSNVFKRRTGTSPTEFMRRLAR